METDQSTINQSQTGAETQSQQASANNSRLFTLVVISVLLTAMITGSIVYFCQKSANEKAINNLEQKISFLREQISVMKDAKITPPNQLQLQSRHPSQNPVINNKLL